MKTYKDIVQCSAKGVRELLKTEGHGIAGVINVAHNVVPPINYGQWVPVLHCPHRDEIQPEIGFFKPILAFYDYYRTKGKVLVHCQAGANRSVGTFGALLVARHGLTPQQALKITGNPGYGAWRQAIVMVAKHKANLR